MHDLGLALVVASIAYLAGWNAGRTQAKRDLTARFLRHVERQRERTP